MPRRSRAMGLLGLAAVAACAASGGCKSSQPNPFARNSAMTASLKDNINQLEIEKSRLETQVADLTTENRRLEDRLVREEAYSSDLADRLDETRRLGRSTDRNGSTTANLDRGWDDPTARRTTPANSKPQKRVPVAQIPGNIEPWNDAETDSFSPRSRTRVTPPEDDSLESDLFAPAGAFEASRSRYGDDRELWLPVARQDGTSPRR